MTDNLRRVERMVRYMRAYVPSDDPADITTATHDAFLLANDIYNMIDSGQLVLSVVDTPHKRYPAVVVNAGDASPDQVRVTLYLNLANHAALCEADRVLAGEPVGA